MNPAIRNAVWLIYLWVFAMVRPLKLLVGGVSVVSVTLANPGVILVRGARDKICLLTPRNPICCLFKRSVVVLVTLAYGATYSFKIVSSQFAPSVWLLVSMCAHLPSHQRNSHEIRARSKCVVEIW